MNKKNQQPLCIVFSFVLLDESKAQRFNWCEDFFLVMLRKIYLKGNNYNNNRHFYPIRLNL